MTSNQLYDPGLQPERTTLAWRRTAVAIAIGSILALRIFPSVIDNNLILGMAPGILGLWFAVWLWLASQKRYRAVNSWLVSASGRPPGAGLFLALSLFATITSLIALVIVVAVAITSY